jgi:hypothetical protein
VEASEALKNLKAVFPSRSRELIKAFLKSEADQKLPTWRVEQVIKFIGLIEAVEIGTHTQKTISND